METHYAYMAQIKKQKHCADKAPSQNSVLTQLQKGMHCVYIASNRKHCACTASNLNIVWTELQTETYCAYVASNRKVLL